MIGTIQRQKLFFLSLAGIVVVSLVLMTTYAYQTTLVDYEKNSNNLVNVNSGVLDVSFKSSQYINNYNMPLLEDYKLADFSEFTINNLNSSDVVSFYIELTELNYSKSLITNDFKYTLIEVVNGIENYIGEGDFSNLDSDRFRLTFNSNNYLEIDKGEIKKYRLYLWLKETQNNQNYLENAEFKGKIEITSIFKNDIEKNYLSNYILNDTRNVNSLVEYNDEEGIGYYYRGNVKNNYVNLSGMCFRVVKIESDGSVKLVLENINGTCESNETNYSLTNDVYGYKEEEGKIKSDIEYTKNILKGFENKIKDLNKLKNGSWCYNEDAYLDESGNNKIENIYENSNVYYEGYVNLKNKTIRKTSCTSKIDGYVGMLTVEDAMMAGITESESESYLNGNYMLMSKSEYSENIDNIFVVEGNKISTKKVNEVATYRPAIKVLKGTIITSGDGTKTNPYVIE